MGQRAASWIIHQFEIQPFFSSNRSPRCGPFPGCPKLPLVGHARSTTLQHYFHRPDMLFLALLSEQLLADEATTAEVAAFWTGRSAAALRKAKQRE